MHFACSQRSVQYADLDGRFDFERDVAKGGASFEDGFLYPLDRPGYGIDVDEGYLDEMAKTGHSQLRG